jgi:hypothetical protein
MTAQQISIIFRLEQSRTRCRRLYGERWAGVVAKYEVDLRRQMTADGSEMLPAALKLGQMLADAGENPTVLFAAAVEILEREGSPVGKITLEEIVAGDALRTPHSALRNP